MISGLSVLLVIVSSVLVVVLLARVLPDIGLPLAIAVGAIISPTDAVATSIVRRAGVRAHRHGARRRAHDQRWGVAGLVAVVGAGLVTGFGPLATWMPRRGSPCGVDLTPHQQDQDSDRLQAGALVGPWCPSPVN